MKVSDDPIPMEVTVAGVTLLKPSTN